MAYKIIRPLFSTRVVYIQIRKCKTRGRAHSRPIHGGGTEEPAHKVVINRDMAFKYDDSAAKKVLKHLAQHQREHVPCFGIPIQTTILGSKQKGVLFQITQYHLIKEEKLVNNGGQFELGLANI